MEIYVNGSRLDVLDSNVAMKFASFRFSGAISDQYTTTIELPKTDRNKRLLDLWGVLERGQMFGQKIPCAVAMRGTSEDGYLTIDAISETIEATLYLSRFPFAVVDKMVRDVVPDTDDTLFEWWEGTTASGNDGANMRAYDNGMPPTGKWCNIHPSINVNWLMNEISNATGVTMPSVDQSLTLLASRKTISPQCETFVARFTKMQDEDQGEVVRCGNHVCIDLDPNEVGAGQGVTAIVINRPCNVSIKVVSGVATESIERCDFALMVNGEVSQTWWSLNTYSERDFDLGDMVEGDKIELTMTAGGNAFVVLTISDYDIKADDYDNDLTYISERPFVIYGTGATPSIYTHPDIHSYNKIGAMANIGEITIRDLLTSLCWVLDRRLDRVGNVLTYSASKTSREIDGEITNIAFVSEHLGKRIGAFYANETPFEGGTRYKVLDNDLLQDEKILHKSAFARLSVGLGMGRLMQYRLSGEEDGQVVEYIETDGVPIARAEQDPAERDRYLLQPFGRLSMCGVEDVYKVLEATITTRESVSDCDVVYLDGHKYLVIEGDYDTETSESEITALLI